MCRSRSSLRALEFPLGNSVSLALQGFNMYLGSLLFGSDFLSGSNSSRHYPLFCLILGYNLWTSCCWYTGPRAHLSMLKRGGAAGKIWSFHVYHHGPIAGPALLCSLFSPFSAVNSITAAGWHILFFKANW